MKVIRLTFIIVSLLLYVLAGNFSNVYATCGLGEANCRVSICSGGRCINDMQCVLLNDPCPDDVCLNDDQCRGGVVPPTPVNPPPIHYNSPTPAEEENCSAYNICSGGKCESRPGYSNPSGRPCLTNECFYDTECVSGPPPGASPTDVSRPVGGDPTLTPTPTTRTERPDVTNTPTPTITPVPGENGRVTPTPTSVENKEATPTPGNIPPGGPEGVRIPIGNKPTLIINIGGTGPTVPPIDPNTPYIRFSIKLFAAEKTPEIKVRLKAVDLINQLTPAPAPKDICHETRFGQFLYKDITMIADNNKVYTPKGNSKFNYNGKEFTVSSDGWVPLIDTNPEAIHAFYIKGPKHRNVRMETNMRISSGKVEAQNLDWTNYLLEPGDLENPNNSNLQDCVVNSVDISLIESRIGKTNTRALRIADVNYDGVVNGNDISKVVHTLSTKPDDDI